MNSRRKFHGILFVLALLCFNGKPVKAETEAQEFRGLLKLLLSSTVGDREQFGLNVVLLDFSDAELSQYLAKRKRDLFGGPKIEDQADPDRLESFRSGFKLKLLQLLRNPKKEAVDLEEAVRCFLVVRASPDNLQQLRAKEIERLTGRGTVLVSPACAPVTGRQQDGINGRVQRVTQRCNGTTTIYEYTDSGRRLKVKSMNADGAVTSLETYSQDELVQSAPIIPDFQPIKSTLEFDSLGRLKSELTSDGGRVVYDYMGGTRAQTKTFYMGANPNSEISKTWYRYDLRGDLTDQRTMDDFGADVTLTYEYLLFDESGNWLKRKCISRGHNELMNFDAIETRKLEYFK